MKVDKLPQSIWLRFICIVSNPSLSQDVYPYFKKYKKAVNYIVIIIRMLYFIGVKVLVINQF